MLNFPLKFPVYFASVWQEPGGFFTDMRMSSSMYEVFNWNTSPDPPLTPAKNKRASLSLPPTTDIFAFDDKSYSNARSPVIHRGASGEFRNQNEVCIGENAVSEWTVDLCFCFYFINITRSSNSLCNVSLQTHIRMSFFSFVHCLTLVILYKFPYAKQPPFI